MGRITCRLQWIKGKHTMIKISLFVNKKMGLFFESDTKKAGKIWNIVEKFKKLDTAEKICKYSNFPFLSGL